MAIVRNVLFNWSGLILGIITGFFLSPFMVHSLGNSMYGLWVLVLSLTGYMGLLDTGLRTSLVRFVARFNATGDTTRLNEVLTTSIAIYSLLSVVVVIITIAFVVWSDHIFKLSRAEDEIAKILLSLGGIGIAIGLPMGVFGALLVGLQRYDLTSKANMMGLLARTVAIVAFLSAGFGVVAVSSIQLVSQILVGCLIIAYSFRLYPSLRFKSSFFTREMVKSLYGYSAFIWLNNFAMYFLFYSGELLVGMFLDLQSVTYYAIATSLVHYLSKFVGAMTQVLHPYASDQHARGNTEAVKTAVLLGTKWCLLIVLPIALSYMVVGKTFIKLWMGPSYAEESGTVLLIAAIGRIAWLSHSSAGNILLGIEKHKVVTSANLATGALGLLLAWILVKKAGLIGVAIGLTVALICSQVFMMGYVMRTFHISLYEYLERSYRGPIIASIPLVAVLLVLDHWLAPRHFVAFFAEVAMGVTVFAVCAYFVAFEREEREKHLHPYFQRFRQVLSKMREA